MKGLQSYRYREDFPLQSLQSGASKCCHSVYGLARGHLILKTFFEFEFLQKGNSKRILKTSTEFTLISLCAHVFNAFYTFFGFGKLISAWPTVQVRRSEHMGEVLRQRGADKIQLRMGTSKQ